MMRLVACVLAFIGWSCLNASALTKKECATLVPSLQGATQGLAFLMRTLNDEMFPAPLVAGMPPELAAAVATTTKEQKAASQAFRSYLSSLEDLTRQLQLCAR